MARNPVASNLLMIILIFGGFLISFQVKQEIFPQFELDIIRVSVAYPGASPAEVEQGILLSIEDEVRSIDGVKRVTSSAIEGNGTVQVEMLTGEEGTKVLQDVKNAVDKILSFPEDAEKPIVSLVEARRQVITLMVYGDQEVKTLRDAAEMIRDGLLNREGITLVEMPNVRPLEIAIEIPEKDLREHNLTLEGIAQIVRETALELPAGGVRSPSGEILLRTQERRNFAEEFADISIISNPDGSKVRLSDIADLVDGFEETDQEAFFNGKPAIRIDVFSVGDQTPIGVSDSVREYLKEIQPTLPQGIEISTWNDQSEIYRQRIDLLLRNGILGLALVLLLLGLFLEPRLAFWVMLGIPISIIGSFLFMPFTEASINMISLFAFIVTLGIIVDDAVVVGEIIYQKREEGMSYLDAAIYGTREIAGPVVFAVLTNIAAFMPLFFVPGSLGKLFLQIPSITVAVFTISLVESLYVLPAHLSRRHKETRLFHMLNAPRRWFNEKLKHFIQNRYYFAVKKATLYPYITFAIGISMLIIAVGMLIGGRIQFSFIPRVDSDLVTAQVVMPFGVPLEVTRNVQDLLVKTAEEMLEERGGIEKSRGLYAQVGSPLQKGGPASGDLQRGLGSHIMGVQLFLVPSDEREFSGQEFANAWRERVGDIPGAETVTFNATIGVGAGEAIAIELSHRDREVLERAAKELAQGLKTYAGVTDIDSGVSLGKQQFSYKLKPEGRGLGLTVNDLARQVRASFYGAEALRQQRGRNEVKILVRLPKADRERIYTVEELILKTPQGGEIPLKEASYVERGQAYKEIQRAEGRRVLTVLGDVQEEVTNATAVVSDVEINLLPQILEKYQGLSYKVEGQQREQAESLDALKVGFLFAMIAIYALMAIPFKSYTQPLIVMLSIPFGILGAFLGHVLLGYELSIISMFGIIALSGVVVNDSLVLIVTANRFRDEDKLAPHNAVIQAALRRFRPILLTSLTTFFGLAPMIFETSMQARFLIPMAVSLGFGVLFATFIILLIVPAVYVILEGY